MKHVLIIDDSPLIRKRIAARLSESKEIQIAGEVGNAHDAIEAVAQKAPDTVILDISLPDQSGIALLKTFKTRYPEMTVIMLSTLDDARYRRYCRRLGADHFLSKIKEFEKIVDTVSGEPAH